MRQRARTLRGSLIHLTVYALIRDGGCITPTSKLTFMCLLQPIRSFCLRSSLVGLLETAMQSRSVLSLLLLLALLLLKFLTFPAGKKYDFTSVFVLRLGTGQPFFACARENGLKLPDSCIKFRRGFGPTRLGSSVHDIDILARGKACRHTGRWQRSGT